MTTRVPLLVELHGKLAKLHELQIRSYAVIWGEVPEAASVYDVVLCTRCHEVAPLLVAGATITREEDRHIRARLSAFAGRHTGHPECLFLDHARLEPKKPLTRQEKAQ